LKVIFLNRFFYPDHSATSQMLSDLAFALAARGHAVEVIAARLTYDGVRALPKNEIVGGVTINRVSTTAFGRGKLLGRTLDYVTFFASASFSLLRHARRGDLVVVKTDPPLLAVLAAPIARLKGARHINWLQDIFPEVASALGMGQTRVQQGALSLLRWVRDLTLRYAAANVVLGGRMAEEVRRRGVQEERITIIANWADGRHIHPIERQNNALREEWGLREAFVVGYSGNLGRAHDLETMLSAIRILEDKTRHARLALVEARESDWHAQHALNRTRLRAEKVIDDRPLQHRPASELGVDAVEGPDKGPVPKSAFRWLFIGGGAQMDRLKRVVKAGGHDSVTFKPYQPRERLAASLSVADVHLISLKPELEGFIVPSKYYGIAAAGRPAIFIGDPDGEIARIIRRSATGFVVREGDGTGLAEAILLLAGDRALAARQGERARKMFESEFGLSRAVTAWESLICKVSQARDPKQSPEMNAIEKS
jgi:glycosyltransferase involved in cell wall biosynthesis